MRRPKHSWARTVIVIDETKIDLTEYTFAVDALVSAQMTLLTIRAAHKALESGTVPWFHHNLPDRRMVERKPMSEIGRWRHISTAPRDGTRVLVTVRQAEQGPADIDVAYWARADRFGIEGWRAADSSPGCIIAYADPELKCWMPMPRAGDFSAALPFDGDEKELFGSGI